LFVLFALLALTFGRSGTKRDVVYLDWTGPLGGFALPALSRIFQSQLASVVDTIDPVEVAQVTQGTYDVSLGVATYIVDNLSLYGLNHTQNCSLNATAPQEITVTISWEILTIDFLVQVDFKAAVKQICLFGHCVDASLPSGLSKELDITSQNNGTLGNSTATLIYNVFVDQSQLFTALTTINSLGDGIPSWANVTLKDVTFDIETFELNLSAINVNSVLMEPFQGLWQTIENEIKQQIQIQVSKQITTQVNNALASTPQT